MVGSEFWVEKQFLYLIFIGFELNRESMYVLLTAVVEQLHYYGISCLDMI